MIARLGRVEGFELAGLDVHSATNLSSAEVDGFALFKSPAFLKLTNADPFAAWFIKPTWQLDKSRST